MMRKIKYHHLKTEKRMTEALQFIDSFIKENGYGPTVREIGAHMRVPSSSTISVMMDNMAAKGYIERPRLPGKSGAGIARAIRISEKGYELFG